MFKRKVHICIWCSKPISRQSPVHLVMPHGGKIIGPLHPDCAKGLVAHPELAISDVRSRAGVVGQLYNPGLEEPSND